MEHCRNKVLQSYRSQNITRISQSSSKYPSSLPFVKTPILAFFLWFLWWPFWAGRIWSAEKRNNANDASYGIDVFHFFIPACRCPFWRINAFCLLISLQSWDRKSRCQTHPVKKNELQSHQVFSEKLWTPISLDHSQVCMFKSVIASNRAHSALLDSIIWDWDITTYNANGKI